MTVSIVLSQGRKVLYLLLINVPAPAESVTKYFPDQVNMSFISQLISGISRIKQKLLKYFNGTAISNFLV